jgi:hypothetical protein
MFGATTAKTRLSFCHRDARHVVDAQFVVSADGHSVTQRLNDARDTAD